MTLADYGHTILDGWYEVLGLAKLPEEDDNERNHRLLRVFNHKRACGLGAGEVSMKFTIPITPTAQARARHGRAKNGISVTYKSDSQKANERTIGAYLVKYAPKNPLSGPLVLEFIAAFPVGRSDSKKTVALKLGGFLLPTKKPDLDNLAKQLKDAMTRLQFWHDDSQVVSLRCEKVYAGFGHWDVAVYEAVTPAMAYGVGLQS